MIWFIAGLLTGAVMGAAAMRYHLLAKTVVRAADGERMNTETVSDLLGTEQEQYAAYEADLLRQMRNMMRYDGTEKGQEDSR